MRDRIRVVITGTPGVGKHTTAKFVANKLGRATKVIDINKFAIDKRVILEKDDWYGVVDVNVKKLTKLMAEELAKKEKKEDLIIVGHLAPYVLKPTSRIDLVVVLRRSPYELTKVLEERKYPPNKIRDNVASEILGISLYDTLKAVRRHKIAEFDTTGKTPQNTADQVISLLLKKSEREVGIIDWLSLVYNKKDLQKFLEY
jgi:adenylate kinase